MLLGQLEWTILRRAEPQTGWGEKIPDDALHSPAKGKNRGHSGGAVAGSGPFVYWHLGGGSQVLPTFLPIVAILFFITSLPQPSSVH